MSSSNRRRLPEVPPEDYFDAFNGIQKREIVQRPVNRQELHLVKKKLLEGNSASSGIEMSRQMNSVDIGKDRSIILMNSRAQQSSSTSDNLISADFSLMEHLNTFQKTASTEDGPMEMMIVRYVKADKNPLQRDKSTRRRSIDDHSEMSHLERKLEETHLSEMKNSNRRHSIYNDQESAFTATQDDSALLRFGNVAAPPRTFSGHQHRDSLTEQDVSYSEFSRGYNNKPSINTPSLTSATKEEVLRRTEDNNKFASFDSPFVDAAHTLLGSSQMNRSLGELQKIPCQSLAMSLRHSNLAKSVELDLDIVSKEQRIQELEREIALRKRQVEDTIRYQEELRHFTQTMDIAAALSVTSTIPVGREEESPFRKVPQSTKTTSSHSRPGTAFPIEQCYSDEIYPHTVSSHPLLTNSYIPSPQDLPCYDYAPSNYELRYPYNRQTASPVMNISMQRPYSNEFPISQEGLYSSNRDCNIPNMYSDNRLPSQYYHQPIRQQNVHHPNEYETVYQASQFQDHNQELYSSTQLPPPSGFNNSAFPYHQYQGQTGANSVYIPPYEETYQDKLPSCTFDPSNYSTPPPNTRMVYYPSAAATRHLPSHLSTPTRHKLNRNFERQVSPPLFHVLSSVPNPFHRPQEAPVNDVETFDPMRIQRLRHRRETSRSRSSSRHNHLPHHPHQLHQQHPQHSQHQPSPHHSHPRQQQSQLQEELMTIANPTGRDDPYARHRYQSPRSQRGEAEKMVTGRIVLPPAAAEIQGISDDEVSPSPGETILRRIMLMRDPKDKNIKGNGIGLAVVGGQLCEDGYLGAFVEHVFPGAVADQLNGQIKVGDEVVEWNGKALGGKSYEEVQKILSPLTEEIEIVYRSNTTHQPLVNTARSPKSRHHPDRSRSKTRNHPRTAPAPDLTYESDEAPSGSGGNNYRQLSNGNAVTRESRNSMDGQNASPAVYNPDSGYEPDTPSRSMRHKPNERIPADSDSMDASASPNSERKSKSDHPLYENMVQESKKLVLTSASISSSSVTGTSSHQQSQHLKQPSSNDVHSKLSSLEPHDDDKSVLKLDSSRKASSEHNDVIVTLSGSGEGDKEGGGGDGNELEEVIQNMGEIELIITFDDYDQSLTVHIARARNLRPMDLNGLSDPFVKVRLHPDPTADSDYNRQSRYMSNSLAPEWEQTVVFLNVLKKSLSKRILEVTVWDFDRLKTNDFMGQVIIPLGERKYLDGKPHWFKLHEMKEIVLPGQKQSALKKTNATKQTPKKSSKKVQLDTKPKSVH